MDASETVAAKFFAKRKQHPSSSTQALKPFPSSTQAIHMPKQYPRSTQVVHKQYPSSTQVVPRFCTSTVQARPKEYTSSTQVVHKSGSTQAVHMLYTSSALMWPSPRFMHRSAGGSCHQHSSYSDWQWPCMDQKLPRQLHGARMPSGDMQVHVVARSQ